MVSLVARTLADLQASLALGAAEGADVVEFRLDAVADEILGPGTKPFAKLVAEVGRPTIAAIHGTEGFGSYSGSPTQRFEILRAAAEAGVTYVDIDASLASAGDLDAIKARCIISTHRAINTSDPSALDLRALDAVAAELDAQVRPGRGDLVKIVPHLTSAEQALTLLDWLEQRPPGTTIAFASGEAAAFTRMAAPAFGSALVYAAPAKIDDPDPQAPLLALAAPGQWRIAHLRAAWGGAGRIPGRSTRLAAVCGRPIGHSASPVTHAAAFRALGADALFLPVQPTSFAAFAKAVCKHPRWVGLSVTAPYKLEALDIAAGDAAAERQGAGSDAAAIAIGAANTLAFTDLGALGMHASNTDAPGVAAAIAEALDEENFSGLTAVILGAGGAARAAAYSVQERGAQVTIVARRSDAAAGLHPTAGSVTFDSPAYQALRPDIIVHTTPLGTDGVGEPMVPAEHLRPGVAVLDAVYRPRETALLRRAAASGAIPISGECWFLAQAWLQHLTLFRGVYGLDGRSDPLSPERCTAAQDAMACAFRDWLSGETSS